MRLVIVVMVVVKYLLAKVQMAWQLQTQWVVVVVVVVVGLVVEHLLQSTVLLVVRLPADTNASTSFCKSCSEF